MASAPNGKNNDSDKLPREFGKYHLIERIASGGMAELYRAKLFGAGGFEKDLAIKKVLPQLARDESFIKMFMDEAMITVTLSHGNIVSVIDFGEVDGEYFLVMEFVDGVDVQSLIRKSTAVGEPFPPAIASYIALEACKGLDYAHRKVGPDGRPLEIVHRDISPQNILISFEGEVKIVDFGIARAASRITSTQAGVVKGKLAYMAPEQISGQAVDRRADIYSLGVSLYEMLTLRRPFEGATPQETLAAITRGVFEPPHKINRKVDRKLSAMIAKALERNPKRRYQTAGELAADLSANLHRAGVFPDPATLAAFVSQRLPEARPRTVQPTPIRAIRGEPAARMATGVMASASTPGGEPAAEERPPVAEAVPFDVLGLGAEQTVEPSDSKRPTDPERPAAAQPQAEILHAPTMILPGGEAAELAAATPAPAAVPAQPEPILLRPKISAELASAKTVLLDSSAQPEVAAVLMPQRTGAKPLQSPASPPETISLQAQPAEPAQAAPSSEALADSMLEKAPATGVSTGALRAQAYPKSSKLAKLAVAGAALLAVAVTGTWLVLHSGKTQPQGAESEKQPPPQAQDKAPSPPPEPAQLPAKVETEQKPSPAENAEASPAAEKAPEPEQKPTAPEAEQKPPLPPKVAEKPAPAPKPKPAAVKPAQKPAGKKPAKLPPLLQTAEPPKPPAAPKEVAVAEKGTGTLRINSEPFAIIYLGEKRLGPTPQLNLKLPAGSHTLTLRNEALGLTKKIRVQINADQVHTVFVDMNKK